MNASAHPLNGNDFTIIIDLHIAPRLFYSYLLCFIIFDWLKRISIKQVA